MHRTDEEDERDIFHLLKAVDRGGTRRYRNIDSSLPQVVDSAGRVPHAAAFAPLMRAQFDPWSGVERLTGGVPLLLSSVPTSHRRRTRCVQPKQVWRLRLLNTR